MGGVGGRQVRGRCMCARACVCVCVLAGERQYATIRETTVARRRCKGDFSNFGAIQVFRHWNWLTEGLDLIEASGIHFKILLDSVVHLMVSVHKPSHAEVLHKKDKSYQGHLFSLNSV